MARLVELIELWPDDDGQQSETPVVETLGREATTGVNATDPSGPVSVEFTTREVKPEP